MMAWDFEQRRGVFVRFHLFQRQLLFTFKSSLYIMHSGIAIPIEFESLLFEKGKQTPETDWDDKTGKPRLVIPVRFGVFWPKKAKNT